MVGNCVVSLFKLLVLESLVSASVSSHKPSQPKILSTAK